MAKSLEMKYEYERVDTRKDDYGNGSLREKILARIADHERHIKLVKGFAAKEMKGIARQVAHLAENPGDGELSYAKLRKYEEHTQDIKVHYILIRELEGVLARLGEQDV